jgi:type II secretory pathway component PulC
MITNKVIIYFFIFIFLIALYATSPKRVKYYSPEIKVNFTKKHSEKVTRVERDPFTYKIKRRRVPQKKRKPLTVIIKGILWDEKNPSAAISIDNGKTIFVNEGERINHIKILKIEKDKIIIDEYGRRTISFK